MKNKFIYCLMSVVILALLSACSNTTQTQNDENDTISIYTTVYPLQYFAERIGGDTVSVQSIYPPGADEHTFDPTQKDMMGLADADLFFYIGLGLEGFVDNAEKTMKNEHVKMVPVAETIPPHLLNEIHGEENTEEHEEEDEHAHGQFDPHVWISPQLSIELAASVKDSLIVMVPEKQAEFEKNFESLHEDLVDLDRAFEDMATAAPNKTFFVSHAAFGYIANTYNLEQIAIAGLNSQSEPSQKQLAALVSKAKELDIQYVLFEQNVSSKLTKVIQKELGVESLMLHNLGILTADDIKNKEDYLSLMEYNLETLRIALSN